ncbi:hypothetical protein ALC57_14816 [Trachymyrmex cornetzi]|uniref:Uncharacterized protein n=1 Tax=Trachymyrmex cornetzi TaxID=471704 RepID=A0A151IXK9_9HYME|nr:hypothetical protein ALC57_14816 [Trachymyrmex cornetzi]
MQRSTAPSNDFTALSGLPLCCIQRANVEIYDVDVNACEDPVLLSRDSSCTTLPMQRDDVCGDAAPLHRRNATRIGSGWWNNASLLYAAMHQLVDAAPLRFAEIAVSRRYEFR